MRHEQTNPAKQGDATARYGEDSTFYGYNSQTAAAEPDKAGSWESHEVSCLPGCDRILYRVDILFPHSWLPR